MFRYLHSGMIDASFGVVPGKSLVIRTRICAFSSSLGVSGTNQFGDEYISVAGPNVSEVRRLVQRVACFAAIHPISAVVVSK